jgi:hypothetical protein
MLTDITECLKSGFDLGVTWTDKDGVLNDPYESDRPENFAPACWSVVAATLYRLTGESKYLEWTEKWVKRTAEILEDAKNSPGFREYVMGYGVMVFPILTGVVEQDKLDTWKGSFAASYTEDAGLSDCHVSATSLLCDLFFDLNREEKAADRAEEIISAFQDRLTTDGFLRDDDVNGHSIPHAYLAASFLTAALLKPKSENLGDRLENILHHLVSWGTDDVRTRIEDLLGKVCIWFKQANGAFHLPVLANRSIYQMYAYPMVALLAYVGEGNEANGRIRSMLNFCQSFGPHNHGFSHTPNHFSPYAVAGLEWTYNRLNTDLGAGLVGWALLALLIDQDWEGLDEVKEAPQTNIVDTEAGYAVLHGENSRMAMSLREHNWGYHLPLQPYSIKFDHNLLIEPIADAKRDGVKHPFADILNDPNSGDPLLEPYFGIAVKHTDGSSSIMTGSVETKDNTTFELSGGNFGLSLTPELLNESIRLNYTVTGLTGDDQPLYSIPVLLWDGQTELRYEIDGAALGLNWLDREYHVSCTGNSGPWVLHMARYTHAGYGLTGNMKIPLSPTAPELNCQVTIERAG